MTLQGRRGPQSTQLRERGQSSSPVPSSSWEAQGLHGQERYFLVASRGSPQKAPGGASPEVVAKSPLDCQALPQVLRAASMGPAAKLTTARLDESGSGV